MGQVRPTQDERLLAALAHASILLGYFIENRARRLSALADRYNGLVKRKSNEFILRIKVIKVNCPLPPFNDLNLPEFPIKYKCYENNCFSQATAN
jgi:hypothetical protein